MVESYRNCFDTNGFLKKEYGSPPSIPDRGGSYGVGMVGVAGGLGPYGR